MLEEAYGRWTRGIGKKIWEQQRRRVKCQECRVEVASGLLMMHPQIHHGVGRGDQEGTPPPPTPPGEDKTYQVSFLKRLLRIR